MMSQRGPTTFVMLLNDSNLYEREIYKLEFIFLVEKEPTKQGQLPLENEE
jgi:hypothetical protein